MKALFYLAFRYLSFHPVKSGLMVLGLSMIIGVPLWTQNLIHHFKQQLLHRCQSTPYLVGAAGNRFELLFKSLYFQGSLEVPLKMESVQLIEERKYGLAIPLHLGHKGRLVDFQNKDIPIVGTTLDYFDFRKIKILRGRQMINFGEVVLGYELAQKYHLAVGQKLTQLSETRFDLNKNLHLKLDVVGVLQKTFSPDDDVAFADIKTSWVLDGIGHSHQNKKTHVFTKGNSYENFHFHGDEKAYPLSSIIFIPNNNRGQVMGFAYFSEKSDRQIIEPQSVLVEMMDFIFKVKYIFNLAWGMMLTAAVIFFTIITSLSVKIREKEMQTLTLLGCSGGRILCLFMTEIAILSSMAFLLAMTLSSLLSFITPHLIRFFIYG